MKIINTNKKTQQGFTLIELVVVIVILGILAVTAAPKFIDLTSDARTSAMQGVRGSIESAVSLAQSRALIDGQTGATGDVLIAGLHYALVNGYPAAKSLTTGTGASTATARGIVHLIDLDTGSDITKQDGVTATTSTFTHSKAPTPATCILTYTEAAAGERPKTVLVDGGC